MQDLLPLVEQFTEKLCIDIQRHLQTDLFLTAFNRYTQQLSKPLARYEHHRSPIPRQEQLLVRFQFETALLHTTTAVLRKLVTIDYPELVIAFPSMTELSYFSWYQTPTELGEELPEHICPCTSSLYDIVLSLSEIIGQLLPKVSTRSTGEFYTPRTLADHLIQLSGFSPDSILEGKRVIDPSCGGGIILISLAARIVQYGLARNVPVQSILDCLYCNVFGFDIQPFAIELTQSLLLTICTPLFASVPNRPVDLFPNVRISDPLIDLKKAELPPFHYVIGNPPYLPVKRGNVNYIKEYDGIVNGHINLYALFLWLAAEMLAPDGVIAFLVPQTLLSGVYYEKLRSALLQRTVIRAVTRMTDRKGVVGDADQPIMAICLQRPADLNNGDRTVDVIMTQNGDEIERRSPVAIPHHSIIKTVEHQHFWVISDRTLDYDIAAMLQDTVETTIGELSSQFVCKNGGFVWNQHKDLLVSRNYKNTLPLVSTGAIDLFKFSFPYPTNHRQKSRSFVRWNGELGETVFDQRTVLIPRVTRRKTGRRLIAALTTERFHDQYPKYLLENHVNAITANDHLYLYGILAWLNSDLVNFLFQMRNGNSLVSVYELNGLPVSIELLRDLSPISSDIVNSRKEKKHSLIMELDNYLLNRFHLTAAHAKRIKEALAHKE